MKLFRFVNLIIAICLAATVSFGQGRQGAGSTGSGGFGGGTSFGSGGSGSFGGGGFGSNSFGSGGFGSGGFGTGRSSGGFGGMGGGFGGQGGGFGFQSGQFGNFGNNQSFVGSDSQDVRQIFEQMGRNTGQMAQQMERVNNRFDRRERANARENQAPPVRVQLKVAFDHPTIASSSIPVTLTARLDQIATATKKQLTKPGFEYNNGVVTLTGIAASQSDRLLIEKLVSLEPGVKRVENRMTLAEEIDAPIPPQ